MENREMIKKFRISLDRNYSHGYSKPSIGHLRIAFDNLMDEAAKQQVSDNVVDIIDILVIERDAKRAANAAANAKYDASQSLNIYGCEGEWLARK